MFALREAVPFGTFFNKISDDPEHHLKDMAKSAAETDADESMRRAIEPETNHFMHYSLATDFTPDGVNEVTRECSASG
jgi:hypothetical protein